MAKYAEITEALKFFVELGGAFAVDEKGYVRLKNKSKIAQVAGKSGNKDLILFQEVVQDSEAQILNPFAEGMGTSPDQTWFYETAEGAFTYRLVEAIQFVVEAIVNTEGTALDKTDLSVNVVKFISPYVKDVDKTTLKEIESITKNFNKFSSLYYNKRMKTAMFRCAIFEGPAFRDSHNVRKKTWKFLEDLLINMFKLDKSESFDSIFEGYKYKTEVMGYPKLDAMLNLYYKLYNQLNPIFDMVDVQQGNDPEVFTLAVDLDQFGLHLSKLDEYFQKAKSIIQPSVTAPANVPVNRDAMPMPGPQGYPPAPGGMPMGVPYNTGGMPMPGQNNNVPMVYNQGNMPGYPNMGGNMPYGGMPMMGQPQPNYVSNPYVVPTAPPPMGYVTWPPGHQIPGGAPMNYTGVPTHGSMPMPMSHSGYAPIGGVPGAQLKTGAFPGRSGYSAPRLSDPPPLL
jgi:hypothetical protein